MFFNGTKKFPSSALLSQSIDQHGGWHEAFTWIEYQRHTVHLPKLQLKRGAEVLFETIVNPIIDEEGVLREKGVIKEGILRYGENPEKAIWDYVWNPLFFEGTSLSHPCTGVEKDVENISARDISNFIDNYFLSDSTVFVLAGDIRFEKAVEVFNEYSVDYNRKSTLFRPNEMGQKTIE